MTSITIIYKCDDIRLHAADCRDVPKDARGATTVYTADFASAQEAAEDFYGDFIAEGSMTPDEAMAYTKVLPCCRFEATR